MDVSLLSSFCVKGIAASCANLPENDWAAGEMLPFLDLYAFMQSDFSFIQNACDIDASELRPSDTIVELLARANYREGAELCAASLAKRLHELLPAPWRFSGVATFLPRLFVADDQSSLDALEFILLTSRALREGHGHRIGVVELVAGSLLDGAWPGQFINGEPVLVANRLGNSEKQSAIVQRLESLITLAQSNGLRLALELEPGPIYALNGLQAIAGIVRELERLEQRLGVSEPMLGLNLDIGHWILDGISPETLLHDDYRAVRDRVFHAHISLHAKSHADQPVDSQDHALREYVGLLSSNCPHFDGFVAVECEAAYDISVVQRSVSETLRLVNRFAMATKSSS